MIKKKSSVNPALLAIISEGFLSRLTFGVVTFSIPLYARSLGFSLAEIGLLISLNLGIAAVLMPLMGHLADRFGLKSSYLVSLGLHSLTPLLLAMGVHPGYLYATRLTGGMSRALRMPTANALIAEHGGKKSIASAFAWYATARSAAGAIGKALAGILITLTAANYTLLFGVAFLASILPILTVAFFVPQSTRKLEPTVSPDQPEVENEPDAAPVQHKKLAPAMLFGFLVNGTAAMLRGLLPLLAVEYGGLTEAETGMLFLVATVVVLITGPVFGWLSDHVSRKLVLTLRGTANIVASAVYLFSPTLSGFMIGTAIDTAGKAAFRPAWGSLMAEVSSQDRQKRGRVMALMSASEEAGAFAGPILAGLLWSTWGVSVLLGVRIGLAIFTEIYALIWFSPPPSLTRKEVGVVQDLNSP